MKLSEVTKIVNLTPHALHVHTTGDVATIPVSGVIARVDVTRTPGPVLFADPAPQAGIRVSVSEVGRLTFTDLKGAELEQPWYPEEYTLYVVSGLVRTYYDRQYFCSPGDPVRDSEGRIVGCRGLDRGKWVES